MAAKQGSHTLKLPMMTSLELRHFRRIARKLAEHNERLALIHLLSSQPDPGDNQKVEEGLRRIDDRVQSLESTLPTVASSTLALKLNLMVGNATKVLCPLSKNRTRGRIATALLFAYHDLDQKWDERTDASHLKRIANDYEERAA